ncbi:MAG TPA: TatD family hydrolase [Acidobacteriota bacterium]|nr:TatD family hydrolase [Acidobacteriota bacterium]
MIFDTHCHGYWRGLAHRASELRENMRASDVARSVQVGTDLQTSRESLKLARDWGSDTWCAAGIHPTGCQDLPPDSAQDYARQLEEFIRDNRDKVVGIGETGLDYFHMTKGRREIQKRAQHAFFGAHAALATKLNLPLIIHTRDAASDTIALIKEHAVKRAVIHCYSETPEFADELLAWSDDVYLSFSGILTYRNAAAVQDTARTLRLDRVMVETDAPFLVPEVVRDRFKINEPAFVRHVMDYLKTLRPEPADAVEQAVWENSNRFFGLGAGNS